MTSEALTQLWEAQQRALRHEKEFWKLADQMTSEGLVSMDDVGVIYGCHPHTARKRLAALHYGVGSAKSDAGADLERDAGAGSRRVGDVEVPNHIGVTKNGRLYNRF